MNPTRPEVEALIERIIPENSLCSLGAEKCDVCRSQPIYIGDVLQHIEEKYEYTGEAPYKSIAETCRLWMPPQFTKSLQEIVSESGYDEVACKHFGEIFANKCPECKTALKSPEANALFSFLLKIGL